jgi:hypothetical protein
MRELFTDAHFTVLADDGAKVVHLVRSVAPFPSPAAIEDTFARVAQSMLGLPSDWALLVDSRRAPMRNDPEFEERLATARARIVARFSRVAVLVSSALGKLQVARYGREDQSSPRVFDDEAAARAFLASRPARPSRRAPRRE